MIPSLRHGLLFETFAGQARKRDEAQGYALRISFGGEYVRHRSDDDPLIASACQSFFVRSSRRSAVPSKTSQGGRAVKRNDEVNF
jgi:hypothetical protein